MTTLASCGGGEKERVPPAPSPFDDDVAFLKQYGEVIVLSAPGGEGRVAVMPGLQGRVMTSTSGAPANLSYGWINRPFFEAGDTNVHMNAFGGEERFWLGPEGGQFSIFFPKDSAFTFENWHTPAVIDLEPYETSEKSEHAATFAKTASLTNYSGTELRFGIRREIRVLSQAEAVQLLGTDIDNSLSAVAYQTVNTLENRGDKPWKKNTGLLSIWLLGMFNPSPGLTMIIPFEAGPERSRGAIVNDDYFGKVPEDRLKAADDVLFFKGDGAYRSKIGLSPARAKGIMGSYDATSGTLTIVQYSKGNEDDVYVNSKWEIQKEPYKGDEVNAYNDGPPSPGAKPMGPFYELESSSPARELDPGENIVHIQTTYHFQGEETQIDSLTTRLLGASLSEVKSAFR